VAEEATLDGSLKIRGKLVQKVKKGLFVSQAVIGGKCVKKGLGHEREVGSWIAEESNPTLKKWCHKKGGIDESNLAQGGIVTKRKEKWGTIFSEPAEC